jgi:hypothetical protein
MRVAGASLRYAQGVMLPRCGLLGLPLVLLLLAGCGDGGTDSKPPPDEYEAELFPTTRVLSEGTLASLVAVDEDGSLRFDGIPQELADLEPPAVLLAAPSDAAPTGFLRGVTAVETGETGLVMRTVHAPLALAFRKLHLRFARRVQNLDGGNRLQASSGRSLLDTGSGSGSASETLDFFAFNGDDDETSTDDQVRVVANLSGGFDYVLGIDFDWGALDDLADTLLGCFTGNCEVDLPEVKVGYEVSAEASAELDVTGVSFLPYKREFSLATFPLDWIKIGPLVFVPEVEIKAVLSGQASSQFGYEFGASASAGMGVSWSSESSPKITPPSFGIEASAAQVDATLAASGRVEIGPELHIRLYGGAGPYAGLMAYAELSAEQGRTPCFELHKGLAFTYGFDVRVPYFDIELASWDGGKDLGSSLAASGSCQPLPGGDAPLPNAGDPTPAAFANPSFEPWSRSYEGTTNQGAYSYPSESSYVPWAEVVPTVDGRLMVAGSRAKALLKLDSSGALVWAKRYVPAKDIYVSSDLWDGVLVSGRVLQLDDATLLVLAEPYTLLKLEANGEVIWAKRFAIANNGKTFLRFTSAAKAPDGGFFVGGGVGEGGPTDADSWVMRLSAAGDVLWSRRWGTPETADMLRQLVAFGDGVVSVGSRWQRIIETNSDLRRGTLVRLNGNGDRVWSKTYETRECGSIYTDSAYLMNAIVARDGDIIAAGTTSYAGDRTLVLKVKPDGTLAWFSAEQADQWFYSASLFGILELPTSGYLVTGSIQHSLAGNIPENGDNLLLGALDGVGRFQWARSYGGIREASVQHRDDCCSAGVLTQDGGVFLAGYTSTLVPDGHGMWVLKLPAKDGTIDFSASSTAYTVLQSTEDPNRCLEPADATMPWVEFAPAPEPVVVTAEPASIAGYSQTP